MASLTCGLLTPPHPGYVVREVGVGSEKMVRKVSNGHIFVADMAKMADAKVKIPKNEVTIVIFGFTLTFITYATSATHYATWPFSSTATHQIEGAGAL